MSLDEGQTEGKVRGRERRGREVRGRERRGKERGKSFKKSLLVVGNEV